MTYAVIPAKDFTGAKQRLATFLHPHERRLLARAMLTDTLTACSQATGLEGVGVVTCDREVAEVAGAFGAEVLWEPQAQGHSQAVAFGAQVCRQRGIAAMLTMPGDIPLLTAADVQAIVLSPPDCLPLAFGHDSFQRHLRLAAERHLGVEIRRFPRVALDIDEPADLALFAAQRVSCHSLQALVTLGILERLERTFSLQSYERVS